MATTNSVTTYSATNSPGDTTVTILSTLSFRAQLTQGHKIMPYFKPGDTDFYPEFHPGDTLQVQNELFLTRFYDNYSLKHPLQCR